MNWYFKLLAQRPHLVLLAVFVFSVACIVVSLTTRKIPDFSDPTRGFEARGTLIGEKLTAWDNLIDETKPSGILVSNPKDLIDLYNQHEYNNHRKKKLNTTKIIKINNKKKGKTNLSKKLNIIKNSNRTTIFNNYDLINFDEYDNNNNNGGNNNNNNTTNHEHWDYGKNLSYTSDEDDKRIEMKKYQWTSLTKLNPPPLTTDVHTTSDGFFCESPNKEYAHFVVHRITDNINNNNTLYEINALHSICKIENELINIKSYEDLCDREVTSNKCCRPWSLPNYIALLSNKTSCYDIQEDDINNVKQLLIDCFQYYHSLKLSNDCLQSKCTVPVECTQHNAVYNILHYLTDVDFIKLNETNIYLRLSMIFLPVAKSTKALDFYYNIAKETLTNDLVKIDGMDIGLKNALFDECLISDSWLIGLGGLFIICCMWLYTSSLFITLMTILAVFFSLGIAYFIYTFIFELQFFPFMNLLSVVVIVGIGADDAFIFVKVWRCTLVDRLKSSGQPLTSSSIIGGVSCIGGGIGASSSYISDTSYSDTLAGLMAATLRHAAISMLVTSLTTAAAFYASFISSITAVRCFGVYAGTAVIVNYILMVTWLPASVSVAERVSYFCPTSMKLLSSKIRTPIKQLKHKGSRIENTLVSIIINSPKVWIFIFGIIGIMSSVIVFYWPKLRLPDSPEFKLFNSNHPFEIYDNLYRDKFWFEKLYTSSDTFKMPLRFVWGILPIDNGNYLNPTARGNLVLDTNFNISSILSQKWLLSFCKNLKKQSFYQISYAGPLLPNCFIENFIMWMGRRCFDEMSSIDRTPCCEISTFPYEPNIFDECLPQSITSLYETPREFFIPGVAGPKFSKYNFTYNNNSNTTITNNNNVNTKTYNSSIIMNKAIVQALVIEYDSIQSYTMSYSDMITFVNRIETWFLNELSTAPDGMHNGWFTSDLKFFNLQDTLSKGTILAICMSMSVALIILLIVTLNILISVYAIITITFTILTTISILILIGWKLNVLESVAVTTAIGLAVDFSLHYGVQYRLSPDADRISATRFALSRMIGPTSMAAITTGIAGGLMLPSKLLAYIQIGVFLIITMTISWLYATFFFTSLLLLIGPEYGFGQFRYPKLRRNDCNHKNVNKCCSAGGNSSGEGHCSDINRDSNHGAISEQLLSTSSSAAGDLIINGNSETHELDSLTSNSLVIKPSVENCCSRPINFDRAFKKKFSIPKEQSPSTASAITMVLQDENDYKN